MKTVRPLVYRILFGLLCCGAGDAVQSGLAAAPVTEVRVMTFNIRYGTADDGPNHWDLRKQRVIQTIRQFQPDLVGTQETMSFQAEYLQQQLDEYTYVGKLREPDQPGSEQSGVLFRRSRFVDLEQGHFWLSETPDVPGSKCWDSSLPRMVTWVKLYDLQSRRPLYLLNTHFDHRGREARRQAAVLLGRRVTELDSQFPVIVTGDFNCGEDSPPYQTLVESGRLHDAYRLAHPTRQPDEGTFNGFRGARSGARIDWVFVSTHFTVDAADIVTAGPDQPSASDHNAVTAILRLQ